MASLSLRFLHFNRGWDIIACLLVHSGLRERGKGKGASWSQDEDRTTRRKGWSCQGPLKEMHMSTGQAGERDLSVQEVLSSVCVWRGGGGGAGAAAWQAGGGLWEMGRSLGIGWDPPTISGSCLPDCLPLLILQFLPRT